MKITGFGRVPRHRTFDYKPVYHDPAMEDLRERVEQAQREQSLDPEQASRRARMSAGFRVNAYGERFGGPKGEGIARTLVVLGTAGLLLAILWLVAEAYGYLLF